MARGLSSLLMLLGAVCTAWWTPTALCAEPVFDQYFEIIHVCWGLRAEFVQLRFGLRTWAHYVNNNGGITFGNLGKVYGVRVTEQTAELASDFPYVIGNVTEKLDTGLFDAVVSSINPLSSPIAVLCDKKGVLLFDTWQSSVAMDRNPANMLPWKLRFSLATDSSTRAIGFVRLSQQTGCTRLGLFNTRAGAVEYADLLARGVRETAAAVGLELVYDETDDFNDNIGYNFTMQMQLAGPRLMPVIAALKEKNVQCFVAVSPSIECITLQMLIQQSQLDLMASFSPQGPQNPAAWNILSPEGRQYVMSGIMWHPMLKYTDPLFGNTQTFVELHNQLWNTTSAQSAAAALAGVMFTLGLRGLHGTNRHDEWLRGDTDMVAKLAGAIGDITQETFFGFIKFNRYNHNTGTVDLTVQYINGTNVVVLPQDVATRRPIFPIPSWQSRTGAGCPPGTFNDGFKCTECPAEHYSDTNATTVCSPCPVGTGQPLTGQTQCLPCAAGTYSPAAGLGCLKCEAGTFQDAEGQTKCNSCPAGTYTDSQGNAKCSFCAAGTYTPEVGSSSCLECLPGFFRPASVEQTDGQACIRCPYGNYQSKKGQDSCLPCPNGRTTLDAGADGLDTCVCPEGTFWNRRDNKCSTCLEGALCDWKKLAQGLPMTSEDKDWVNLRLKGGENRRLSAVLTQTYTRPSDFAALDEVQQLERLRNCYGPAECPPGLGLPAIGPGYYAEKVPRSEVSTFTGPSIFECTTALACPGGQLSFSETEDQSNVSGGLCTQGRIGIACNRCQEGWAFDKVKNICRECSDSDKVIPLLGVAIGLFGIAPVLYLAFNISDISDLYDSLSIGLLATQVISFAQGLNVFGSLSVEWDGPFYEIANAFKVLRFDFDFVVSGCSLKNTATQYAFVVFFPAMIATSCLLWLLISKLIVMTKPYTMFQTYVKRIDAEAQERRTNDPIGELQRQSKRNKLVKTFVNFLCMVRSRMANGAMNFDRMFNSIAYTTSAFYVSVCANCLVPVHALQNPSGQKTLQRYPHIIYGSDEWNDLLAIGITGLVIYIGCWLPHLIWAAYVAPDRMMGKDGASFLTRYGFLLPAYRPEFWWWGVALIFKSLLQALIPIIGFGDGQIQATIMALILGCFFATHMNIWPYKTFANNLLDGTLTFLLMLIAGVGVYFGTKVEEDYPFFSGYVMTLLACAVVTLVVGMKLSADQLTKSYKMKEELRCDDISRDIIKLSDLLCDMDPAELRKAVKGLVSYDRHCVEKACLLYKQEILMLRDEDEELDGELGDKSLNESESRRGSIEGENSLKMPGVDGRRDSTGSKTSSRRRSTAVRRLVMSEMKALSGERRRGSTSGRRASQTTPTGDAQGSRSGGRFSSILQINVDSKVTPVDGDGKKEYAADLPVHSASKKERRVSLSVDNDKTIVLPGEADAHQQHTAPAAVAGGATVNTHVFVPESDLNVDEADWEAAMAACERP